MVTDLREGNKCCKEGSMGSYHYLSLLTLPFCRNCKLVQDIILYSHIFT